MLSAASIRHRYIVPAGELVILRDVSLQVAGGESLAILGPSGSGKSTLLHILGTLEPPTAGRVLLDGCDPYSLRPRELARFRSQTIGFVFQDHLLLPQCSALENVLLPTLAGRPPADAVARARGLLERVGLADREDHRPAQLSGGEKQRVALARALMNRPQVVLADEPTGNLDRVTAEQVGDLLVSLPAEQGVALVAVTHSEALAGRFGRVYDLADGVLVARPGSRAENSM